MIVKKTTLAFCFGALVLFPTHAHAVRLYLLPLRTDVPRGDQFTVQLRLDTQGVPINAVDVGVTYPKNLLAFDSFSDESSLVNIWIEHPDVREKNDALVTMSGVAPGGFTGDALIAQLTFHGTALGDARIAVAKDSTIILDGPDGQLVGIVSNDAFVKVQEPDPRRTPVFGEPLTTGSTPLVTVQLSKTPVVYEDKWFVSFFSQGKDFGIKGYQVRERFLGIFGGEWKKAESPYVIEHQNLLSTIEIQALTHSDASGESIVIPGKLKMIYGVLIASLLSLVFVSVMKRVTRGLPPVV